MIAVALALVLLAGPAERPPLEAGDIDWLEWPTGNDMSFTPYTTARPGEVLVVLECRVGEEGRLDQCRVAETTGRDSGEVQATLRVASRFRMTLRTKSGESTAGRKVRVPVRWKPPA